MGYARVLASHCSCSSGIMGIIVIDSSFVAVSGRVSCSLRVPAHIMVQPIIQRNTATGSNNSLISRLRIWFFTCQVSRWTVVWCFGGVIAFMNS